MGNPSFIFCVHNNQPVDNFDEVFQRGFEDAYLPFLEAMKRHPALKFCAHYSGPLLEWIARNRLDLFMLIRNMVDAGRLELLSGGFYEPIFSMLPEEDALGQVEMMNEFLRKNFGVEPQGLWLPERVWEPHLPTLLAKTGLRYTVIDDFHFRATGLRDEELYGHYVTEDRGAVFNIFPCKERLRYAIPFESPQATVEYLRRYPDEAALVYADNGEKFGIWPETKKHVYEDGWLERFLSAIEGVRTTTFSEALQQPARGRIYLPTCSYREMGEWALMTQSRAEYEALREDLKRQGRFESAKPFLVGGFWRNFLVKYPEANLMYGRMLSVSERVAESSSRKAREELYRAQCNCAYWHGVFGGLYMPHLRDSVYRHLILADNEVESKTFGTRMVDLNLDGQEEVRLTNKTLNLFIAPALGGQILELDVRPRAINLGATLARRPESYHADVILRPGSRPGVRSIHEKYGPKEPELEKHLRYDPHLRTSLVDHFFAADKTAGDCDGDQGDFVEGVYAGKAAKQGTMLAATYARDGRVLGVPVRVEKKITLREDATSFQAAYDVHAREPLEVLFAVEFNIAALNPEGFGRPEGDVLRVRDAWHDLDLEFLASSAAGYWVYPVRTVSNSEAGFELNYQCTAVVPYWKLRLGPDRPWSGVITFKVEAR